MGKMMWAEVLFDVDFYILEILYFHDLELVKTSKF